MYAYHFNKYTSSFIVERVPSFYVSYTLCNKSYCVMWFVLLGISCIDSVRQAPRGFVSKMLKFVDISDCVLFTLS